VKRRLRPTNITIGRWVRLRIYVAAFLLSSLFAVIAYKAYAVQVQQQDHFHELARRQHVRTVEVPAPRGPIYDTNGKALAVTAEIDSVWANPREVIDVASTAESLAEALDEDVRELEDRLASRRHFVWASRHVTSQQAAAVRKLELAGVYITQEPRRFYPGKSLAGPLLGFAGIDGNGLDGLELAMEELLVGKRASMSALRDAAGKVSFSSALEDPEPGAAVRLTIDRSIQFIAERALGQAVEEHKAKSGTVIVLDVLTSEVLAMASWPTIDPNDPAKAARGNARNRAVTDVFEVGSVMKIFTIAAALDAGAVQADTMIDTEHGRYKIGRKVIRDSHHDTELSVGGVLKRSSNVGAVKIARRTGKELFHKALLAYGFGRKTEIELPGEQPGLVHPPNRWGEIGLATVSYGYGLLVTTMQVVTAIAAVGNDGVLTEPRVVKDIRDGKGKLIYERQPVRRRIMSSKTAASLRTMLASVFDKGRKDGGTARKLDMGGFVAGGKTGTAHKVDPNTGKYGDDLYLASFGGIAPIDDPRIAVLVMIDEPRGEEHYGSKVAGPTWAIVVTETLRYLGIPSAPGQAPAVDPEPAQPTRATDDDGNPSEGEGLAPALEGATDDDEEEGEEEDTEPLVLDPAIAVAIPDFSGMSIARALDLAREQGIEIEIIGSGVAVDQFPEPGWAPKPAECRVHFAPSRQ
jgi:cell division protein FtsI (penicillin-binding protein 3)